MPVMSEWVQANTSILWSSTYSICSFSTPDRMELTYVDLSSSASDIDSKGQWLIAPCLPPALGRRSVVAILRLGSQGLDCGSFRFSHVLVLTIGRATRLLVGCLRGRFAQHWSNS